MSDRQRLEGEVKDWVAGQVSARREQLHTTTRIEQDLGITGDDASELMAAFGERFEVDLSEFKFDHHFGQEGGNPFSFIYLRVFARHQLETVPVTIDDLVEAALQKKWQTPKPTRRITTCTHIGFIQLGMVL